MAMHPISILAGLCGGIGLFIFGMQLCSEGLQKLAAQRLRNLVKVLTGNRVVGLLSGAVITLGLQSSSAASALVVGLVSAKLMTLSQALGVLLGSAIGASLTAQLIVFKITDFALMLICGGAGAYLFAKRSRQRNVGQALLGFGLIFYGMFVMAAAMAPVREYPAVAQVLARLALYPVIEFGVALLVTAIFQSSPAFLALLMTLATQKLIGPLAIVPFVLGAHLGGTITGLISSLGAPGQEAKRAAWANFLFKLLNGLIFLPLYRPLTELLIRTSSDLPRFVANAHTFFSLAMAVVFLPLNSFTAKLVERLLPDRQAGLGEAALLDVNLLSLPEMALEQAHRQTLAMGRLVETEMLQRMLEVIRYGNDDSFDRIHEIEQALDALYKQISKYVTSLKNDKLSEAYADKSLQILYVANDLEHIGDIMHNIVKKARMLRIQCLEFSKAGLEELATMISRTQTNFGLSLQAFETMDTALATQVIKEYPNLLRFEKDLRYSHFDRMQGGNAKTKTTSAIHLDLVESILRINSHAVDIAQVVVGIV
jgi:phosphate:Na+ symporter